LCIEPHAYRSWSRNQPGYWPEKAWFDKQTRLRLEAHGQMTFMQARESRNKVIEQYLLELFEKRLAQVKQGQKQDVKDWLIFANSVLRDVTTVTQRLTEIVKNEYLTDEVKREI
jgi:hypothetical protein